jgi:hypothetical protein
MLNKESHQLVLEAKKARIEFCSTVNRLPWNNGLRTKSENLLIIFDQLLDRFENPEKY